ncbi:uncharacterized protein J3D65DRAFT_228444 [Phyllosticta citribraziliensis]|uniref:Myb-like domain-containing protein n=1 Tax=Phyllosticta citribraziliensis TaxID=989973 RepID=A0ABR1M5B8_9PEZI
MLSSYSRWNVDVPPNIDLDRRQERNRQRMKSRFERIFEQYERDFTGQDDEIDLETGEIVVNNGHLESMPDHDGSEEFGGLLNLGHDAQYHDDYFHGAELTPRGDDEEDELAAMCPVGLLAVAVREPSPRPAGSPAASPIPQANAPEETPHDTSGKVDQVTEMEKQIQQMSRQLQELRQLVTQPSIQPLAEPERPKDPKWYAPPLPNPPRIYRKSEDSVWDAPPLPGHLPRQENPKTSPVHDIEELEIPGPTEATAWDLATPVEMVRRLWTEKENELILELRGKNLLFREIAAQLPGRTTAQVVTHWHTIQDRLDKQNTVSESFERDSERCEEASNAATRRREKLPLGSVDKNSEEINLTDASSAARENETSTESNMSEFDKSVAQPPEDVRLESNTDQRPFRRSRRKTLSTQSLFLPHDRGSASPPAAAQQPAAEPALETTQETAQPPEHSCQSSTQSLAEEVREWCKSKIGATDNPRRPYFCQLCGHYWRTEEKVMSHFFKASGCKALPLRRLRQPSKSSEPWTCVRCCQTWATRAGADSHGADLSLCQPIALHSSTTDEPPSQRTSPDGDDFEDQPIPPSPMVVIPAWPRGRHIPLNVSPKANDASNYSSETNGKRSRRHRTSFAKRTQKDMSDPPSANETPLAKRTKIDKAFITSTPTVPAGESVQDTSPRLPQTKGIMNDSYASDRPENDLSTGTDLIETPPTSFVEDAVDLSENSNGELASLFEEAGATEAATESAKDDDVQSASKATPAPTATQSSLTSTAACAAIKTPKAAHDHSVVVAERTMMADEVPQADLHGASTQEHFGEQERPPPSPEPVASETQAPTSPDGPPDSEDDTDLDLDDSAIQSMIEDPDSFIVESTEVDPDPTQLIGYLSPAKSESEDELQKASSPCPILSENAVMLPKPQAGSSSPADSLARRRRSQGRKPLAISLLDKEAPSASARTPRRQQLPTKASQRSLVKSSTKSAVSSFKTPAKPASASKRSSSSSSSSRKARQNHSAKSNGVKDSPLQKSSAPQKPRKSRLSDMLLPGGDSDDDLF